MFLIGIKRGLASKMLTYSNGTNQKDGQSLLWSGSRYTPNRRMDYNYAMITPFFDYKVQLQSTVDTHTQSYKLGENKAEHKACQC